MTRFLFTLSGAICFWFAAWLINDPIGEFNILAVVWCCMGGVLGIYGGVRG